jgi:hypothetical protein
MRRSRNEIPDSFLKKPFDVMQFGSEDDPCFGKLYDLTTPECQACGDSEACSIVFLRELSRKRLAKESDNYNLDLEIDGLEFEKAIRDEYQRLRDKKFKKLRAKALLTKKFNTSLNKINTILK